MGTSNACLRKASEFVDSPNVILAKFASYSISLKNNTPASTDSGSKNAPQSVETNGAQSLFGVLTSPSSSEIVKISSSCVSEKIVKIGADFWNSKISTMSYDDQIELSVALFLDMAVRDKSIMAMNKHVKIEARSLKFLNMVGWLIRILHGDYGSNLEESFRTLGNIHKAMGLRSDHFVVMRVSLHDTFAHYFPHDYGIKQQYAIDFMFLLASNLMMGEAMTLPCDDSDYLSSLQACLHSAVGREYLYRYLQQTWCDEIVIYLQGIRKFEQQTNDKGRFMIARNIVDVSINAESDVAVNISYECRMNAMRLMSEYDEKFRMKEDIKISSSMFESVTEEMYVLIFENHWREFKKNIRNMSTSKKQ